MPKLIQPASPTSVVLRLKLMDSTSTTGAGKTGLTSGTAGLAIHTMRLNESVPVSYYVSGGTIQDISTLGTYAAPAANSCRFKEVNSTLLPGVYELHLADSRFTSQGLIVSLNGATGLAQADFEIQCQNIAADIKAWLGTAPNALVSGRVDAIIGAVASGVDVATQTSLTNTYNRIGTPISGSISQDIQNLSTSVVAGVPQNFLATSGVLTNGTNVSGSYLNTQVINNAYWLTAPSATALGGYGLDQKVYFNVGSTRVSQISVAGRFQNATGSTRSVDVWAYNYQTSAYDSISNTVIRINHSTTDQIYSYTLLSQHQNNAGDCIIRFTSTSTNTGDRFYFDQILCKAVAAGATTSEIAQAVYLKMRDTVYVGGIWIDTINGVSGTDIGINGIQTNPVNNIADALTMADALNIKTLYFRPDSKVSLPSRSFDYWRFIGRGIINLNGQSINDTVFEDCEGISGTSSGQDSVFIRCVILNSTVDTSTFHNCFIRGIITSVISGSYNMVGCVDDLPGSPNPSIVCKGNNNFGMRMWSGGLNIISATSTDNVFIDGSGRIVIEASCTGGALTVRGFFPTPTRTGTMTVTETSRYDVSQPVGMVTGNVSGSVNNILNTISASVVSINDGILTSSKFGNDTTVKAIKTGQATAGAAQTITLDAAAVAIANYYNGSIIQIISGTGIGQQRTIVSYTSDFIATVDSVWITNPDNTSQFVILPSHVRCGLISTGVATAGAASTITLKTGEGYAVANYLAGSSIHIIAGTGKGQLRSILSNTAVTPTVVTVDKAWATNVDNTSVYEIYQSNDASMNSTDYGAFPANAIAATSIATGAITNAKFAAGAIDAAAIATDAIGSAEFSQAAADKIWLTTSRSITDKAGFGLSGLDASTRVVLSANQPDYAPALQSTLLAGIANISGSQAILITKSEGISGTQTIIITKVDNISADTNTIKNTQTTIISKEDSISASINLLGTPMQSGTNVLLDPNVRVVLSAGQPDYNIPTEVNVILTSAHGSGQWDAVNNTPVVLSADQPYYRPAVSGDVMTIESTVLANLIKHTDLIDGKSVDYILEAAMAMVNGNFSISGDSLTLYKRNGTDVFSVINKTTTTRTRVS